MVSLGRLWFEQWLLVLVLEQPLLVQSLSIELGLL